MSAQNPSKNKRLMMLTAAGGAVLVLVGAQWQAEPQTTTIAAAKSRDSRAGATASTEDNRADTTDVRALPGTERLSLAGTPPVRELFRPLIRTVEPAPERPAVSNAPVLPPVSQPVVPTVPPTPTTPEPAPEPPAAPTADIQMSGVVELGDEVLVLLKKTSTGESRYFAKGEDAFGFTVGEIKANEVALQRDGETFQVAMSTAIPVEIRGGGSLTGTSAPGAPGTPSPTSGRTEERGGRNREGRGEGGVNTSELFNLATWAERLKKLEEIKGQLEPQRYERLKRFFEERAQREQQNR